MKTVFPKNKLKDFLFKPSQFKGTKSQKKRLAYYEKALEAYQSRGKNTWNWVAFFFGPFWAVYRGMYLWSFVALILMAPAVVVMSKQLLVICVTFIPIHLIWGLLANRMYFKFINRRYKKGYVCEGTHLIFSIAFFLLSVFIFPILMIASLLEKRKNRKTS
jgi:hypothetical protein